MASESKKSVSANQELIGQGLGNIASSLSHGYPVSGSFSRSAVNFSS
jgi:SulP family sulfate permease